MSRKIQQIADVKWAHPESYEDGWYVLKSMEPDFREIVKWDGKKAQAAVDKLRAGEKAALEASDAPEYVSVEWKEYFAEKGCPEEPDIEPLHILVATPKGLKPNKKLPAVFCISGGGLVCGGEAEQSALLGRKIIDESGEKAIQVCFDYRIAGVAQYPASVNDCHAAYQWMIEHADELQIDTDRIVIWGTSSGGHHALCLGFRLKRYNWCNAPMPRGLVIHVPVMDDTALNVSNQYYMDKEDGSKAGWDSELACITYKVWLGDRYGDPALSPEAVPNRATLEDVKGYPPVWIPGEAEFDCGRDSVYKFAALLHEAGVFCDLHVWGGTTHQGFSYGDSHFGRRIHSIITGAIRDAIKYDFRRAWLNVEEEGEKICQ